MKSRAILLCLQICLIAIDFSTAAAGETNAVVTDPPPGADEHNKLLLECQHPDYRTYIKCLKRHKRHHWHSEHDSEGGETKSKCFEECGMDQCESTKCVHDCHKRCMKKTKETRQIITQYETTCDSGDCTEEKRQNLPATNITTNIDINNVINNHMPNITESRTGSGTSTNTKTATSTPTDTERTCTDVNNPNCCSGRPCYGGGWYGGYGGYGGLTLVPQIQFVPQITFGLGAAAFPGIGGGGMWQQGQTGGVDCSPCANPILRYRCDVSCYAGQATGQVVQNTGRMQIGNAGCTSPQCIGGV